MGSGYRQINLISVGTSHIDIIVAIKKEFGLIDILYVHSFTTGEAFLNGKIVNYDIAKRVIEKEISEVQERVNENSAKLNINLLSFYIGLPSVLANIDYGFTSSDLTTVISQKERLVTQTDIIRLYNKCERNIQRQLKDRRIRDFIPRTTYCDQKRFYPNPNKQMCKILSCDYIYTYPETGIEQTWEQLMNESGYIVENIIFDNILGFISMFNDNEKEKGSILIDIGSKTTTVTMYKKYLIGVHSIAIGSQHITEEICRSFHCSFEVAEAIKKRFNDIYREYVHNPQGIAWYYKMDYQESSMPLEMVMDLFNNKFKEITYFINSFINHITNINRLFEIKYSIILDERINKAVKKKAEAIINSKIKAYKDAGCKALGNEILDQLIYELSFIDRNISFPFEDQEFNGALLVAGGGSEMFYEAGNSGPLQKDKVFVFDNLIFNNINNQPNFNLFLKTKINYQNELSSEEKSYFNRSTYIAIGALSYLFGLDIEDESAGDTDEFFLNINILSKKDLNIRYFY